MVIEMTREVSLKLTYGDTVMIQPEPDHEHAVVVAYAAMLDQLPDETDLLGLPEPVTEEICRPTFATAG